MCRRWAITLFGLLVIGETAFGQAPATIEIDLPPGSTATLDGTDLGERRKITVEGIAPGKLAERKLIAKLPNGKTVEKTLLLKSGWHVRVPIRVENNDAPEPVPQGGHGVPVIAHFSQDGRWVLSSGQNFARDPRAIVWEYQTGRVARTLVSKSHAHAKAIGFVNNSSQAVTFDDDGIHLWSLATGKITHTLNGENGVKLADVAVSGNGKFVAAVGYKTVPGKTIFEAYVWEADTAKRTLKFTPEKNPTHVALTSDGSRLALDGGGVEIYDATTGKPIISMPVPNEHIDNTEGTLVFSPNGKWVMGTFGENAHLWNTATGERLWRFPIKSGKATCAQFSPDSECVVVCGGSGSTTGEMHIWKTVSGEGVTSFPFGHSFRLPWVIYHPNGKEILSLDGEFKVWFPGGFISARSFKGDGNTWGKINVLAGGKKFMTSLTLWDSESGKAVRTYKPVKGATFVGGFGIRDVAAASETGTMLVYVGDNYTVRTYQILNPESGEVATDMRWQGEINPTRYGTPQVAMSPDGKYAFTTDEGEGDQALWSGLAGTKIKSYGGTNFGIGWGSSCEFSPSSDRFVHASGTHVFVTDAATDKTVMQYSAPESPRPGSLAYRSDGKAVLAAFAGGKVVQIDIATGKPTLDVKVEPHDPARKEGVGIYCVGYDVPGTLAFATLSDMRVVLWDLATGKLVRTLTGHDDVVHYGRFLNDRYLITTGYDHTNRLWDVATGDELARLHALPGRTFIKEKPDIFDFESKIDDWLVTTPDGLFDGSPGGREHVVYRVGGMTLVPVDRFFQDFYRPGLLAALLRGERPTADVKLGGQKAPSIKIVSPASGNVDGSDVTIVAEVLDEGGGVTGPWITHNGMRVRTEGSVEKAGNVLRRTFKLRLAPGTNTIEVKASSADGSWESEPAKIQLVSAKPVAKVAMHVLAVGVNKYADPSFNLRYAAPDAKAVATLFQDRGREFFREVSVTVLTDGDATKDNIRNAVKAISAKAAPEDVLVVFLAGHGVAIGQRYFFITADFNPSPDVSGSENVRKQGLAGDVINEWLDEVKATKRVVIYDTCHAGAAVSKAGTGRDPFAFRGAIETLKRSNGAHTLAAAASGQEAKEVDELGHGVLTYALLAGVGAASGGPLADRPILPGDPSNVVSVLEWFSYAAGHVPRLTEKYFQAQQQVSLNSAEQVFPLIPTRR